MKFSCTQEKLRKGLQAVSSISGKNVNLPILNNVLMKVDGSRLEMVSTNLEVAVRSAIRGKAETAGEFTVPSKLLVEYVNLLPEDKVDLAVEGQELRISCLKNETSIRGINASEFPLIPKIEGNRVFRIPSKTLKRAVSQVAFAVSSVESRPELTGVLFNISPAFASGKLVMAATDSYRLSERIIGFESDKGRSMEAGTAIIVPGRTLSELARILSIYKDDEADGQAVEISMGDSQIAFRFGDIELVSRLIDGRYPDYRPIIPEKFATEAVVDVSMLSKAVKGSSLFSRAGLQDVNFSFDQSGTIKVSSGEGAVGKNVSVLEADVKGKTNSITVNYRYFLDGLGAIEGSRVRIKIIDAVNPCLLSAESDDSGFLYVVMPIRQ